MRMLTVESFKRYIPKKYHHIINFNGFDVDWDYDGNGIEKPKYFLCLKDGWEFYSNPGCGTECFFTIKELRSLLKDIIPERKYE